MMYNYRVIGAVANIPSGSLLVLDEDQIRRRQHALQDTETEDVVMAKTALQFKHGEEFKCDQEVDKLQIGMIECTNTAAEAVEETVEAEEADPIYYEDMDHHDLVDLCRVREIKHHANAKTGTLINKLVEWDEKNEAGE